MTMFYDDVEGNNTDFNSWFQSSYYLPSITPQGKNSCQSFLALPEIPLQPSLSADMAFLNDPDKHEDCQQNKTTEVNISRIEGQLTRPSSTGNDRGTLLKRSRHEVHSIAERRRRKRINGKLKILQELMPHCKRKDRASILDEAAKYIKSLKQQVETMTKVGQVEYMAPYMPCSGNPSFQLPLVPFQHGAGMWLGCYAGCTPVFQLPLGVVPSSASSIASFYVPTTGLGAIEPTILY